MNDSNMNRSAWKPCSSVWCRSRAMRVRSATRAPTVRLNCPTRCRSRATGGRSRAGRRRRSHRAPGTTWSGNRRAQSRSAAPLPPRSRRRHCSAPRPGSDSSPEAGSKVLPFELVAEANLLRRRQTQRRVLDREVAHVRGQPQAGGRAIRRSVSRSAAGDVCRLAASRARPTPVPRSGAGCGQAHPTTPGCGGPHAHSVWYMEAGDLMAIDTAVKDGVPNPQAHRQKRDETWCRASRDVRLREISSHHVMPGSVCSLRDSRTSARAGNTRV